MPATVGGGSSKVLALDMSKTTFENLQDDRITAQLPKDTFHVLRVLLLVRVARNVLQHIVVATLGQAQSHVAIVQQPYYGGKDWGVPLRQQRRCGRRYRQRGHAVDAVANRSSVC